ncbi:MAG: hypothetical protein AB7I33_00980 [Gemmatimonadales bacterium]
MSSRTLALIPVAVAINLAVGRLVNELGLPVYLDTIGTVLATVLAGPLVGITTGLVSQFVAALVSGWVWLAFAPIQVIISLLAWAMALRAGCRTPIRAMGWGALTGLVGGAASALISYLAFKGVTATGVTAVTTLFRGLGLPLSTAVALASVSTDVVDKILTFALAATAVRSLPKRMAARFPLALRAAGG